MVRIDLLAPAFMAGKPGFDRTLARLQDWDARRNGRRKDGSAPSWDILFAWSDGDSTMSTMQFPLNRVRPADVHEVEVKPVVSIVNDCWATLYSPTWEAIAQCAESSTTSAFCDMNWTDELEQYFEWASLASTSSSCIKTYSRPDHLSSYQVGSSSERQACSIVKVVYRGLLCSGPSVMITRHVQDWLSSPDASSCGATSAIISCSGFADSPIAWTMDPVPSGASAASLQESEDDDEETESSNDNPDDHLLLSMTGRKARKKRQKKRSQRGHISRHQVGEQVKRPGMSGYNGWQIALFDRTAIESPEYISVENIGGCLRC